MNIKFAAETATRRMRKTKNILANTRKILNLVHCMCLMFLEYKQEWAGKWGNWSGVQTNWFLFLQTQPYQHTEAVKVT